MAKSFNPPPARPTQISAEQAVKVCELFFALMDAVRLLHEPEDHPLPKLHLVTSRPDSDSAHT